MANMALREIVKPKINKSNFPIILILALSIFLRVLGTNPGYPEGHPDESTIADSTTQITFYLNFEPVGFYYGQLLPIVYAMMNWFFFIPLFLILILPINLVTSLQKGHTGTFGCFTQTTADIWHCILSRSKDYFYFLARYETAIISALAVIAVYLLCKELFNKKVGIIAAFFTAVNYRHVLSSNLSLADSPVSTIALISVFLSIKIIKEKTLRNYLFAGLGLGLALSVKYFIYVIPTLFICHAIAHLRSGKNSLDQKLLAVVFDPKLPLSLAISILVFFVINPFLIINHETAQYQLTLNASHYGGDISLSRLSRIFSAQINLFPFYYLFKFGLGQLMSFAIIFGFLYALYRHTVSTLIISSVALSFLFFFLILSGTPNVRNYAAIIPFLLIFPAILVDRLTPLTGSILDRIIPKRVFAKLKTGPLLIGAILLALILGFSSLKNSFLSSYYFSKPRNQQLLLDWTVEKLPDNASIAKTWGVPFPSYKKVETLIDWSPIQESYMSLEELKDLGVQWVMVSSDSGTYISNLAWFYYNDLIKKVFFNDQPLSDYLNNSYVGLVTREIGSYRVKEFTKSSKSPDPEFFVSEIPAFWEIKKDNLITSYKFDKEMALQDYSLSSGCYKLEQAGYIEGHNFKGTVLKFAGMNQSGERPDFSRFTLPAFNALENKWYTLSGRAVLYSPFTPDNYKGGFWRLDFYSNDNRILKTYVSKQLSKIDKTTKPSSALHKLQNLNAAGMAPRGTIYAKVSFQSDECHEGQSYLLYDLQVFESDYLKTTNIDHYPYFYKELPKSFIWQLPL